jgi:hypothetical protein
MKKPKLKKSKLFDWLSGTPDKTLDALENVLADSSTGAIPFTLHRYVTKKDIETLANTPCIQCGKPLKHCDCPEPRRTQ